MYSHCIPQPSVQTRRGSLTFILTMIGLTLGFSGCGDNQPAAETKSVEVQAPDSLVENGTSKPLSSSALRVEKQPNPISNQAEPPNKANTQDGESGKSALTQNTSKPEQTPATTRPVETLQDTTAREALSHALAKQDAVARQESAAILSQRGAANLSEDSVQNIDPDVRRDEALPDSNEQDEQDEQDEVVAPLFEIADEQTIEFPDSWKRLGQNEIWIDMKSKQVILAGYVCINVGALEMFACPAGTKEHESIVAVNALASEMHAALLAVGAEPGAPCSWDDVSFTTASGSKINIDVRWRDEKTNEVITRPAKEMLKVEGDQKLDIEWIFGGSRFLEDVEAKFRSYSANSGEMICVSNFSTAAIDVNIDSTDANGSWLFWANTEKVPARGTRVYLILSPGDYFKAQRHVLAEAEPLPEGNMPKGDKEINQQPATREPDGSAPPPSEAQPIEGNRLLTPAETKEPSSETSSEKG